ncbi:MAG: hypothetical protein ABSG43_05320 [Solirubrobacteraceae bacterium]
MSRLQQGQRGIEVPKLAQRDGGAVEHHRLTRLRFEDLHGSVGNRHQHRGLGNRGRACSGRKSTLEQHHPRVVAAIRILQPGGVREQHPVGVDVAAGQQLLGPST